MPAVIVYSLWHELGFTTLVFLGGLAVISDEYGEAARVDGCGPWREFWYITWPQLRPVTTFVVSDHDDRLAAGLHPVLRAERGGPNKSTDTLSFLVFQEASGHRQHRATARRSRWCCSPSRSSSRSSGGARPSGEAGSPRDPARRALPASSARSAPPASTPSPSSSSEGEFAHHVKPRPYPRTGTRRRRAAGAALIAAIGLAVSACAGGGSGTTAASTAPGTPCRPSPGR